MALYCNLEKACRVCLRADTKLYPVSEHRLAEKLVELTGVQVLLYDGLPQYLCVFCCERLRKSLGFRNMCKETYEVMGNQLLLGRWPTVSQLKKIHTSNQIYQPMKTDVVALTYPSKQIEVLGECIYVMDDNCEVNKTKVNSERLSVAGDKKNKDEDMVFDDKRFPDNCDSKNESGLKVQSYNNRSNEQRNDIDKAEIDINSDITDFDKDMNWDEDSNEIIENILFCGPVIDGNNSRDQRKIYKPKVIKKITMEVLKEDKIKKFTDEYLDNSSGMTKVFYKHILDKYIKNIKSQKNNDTDSSNDEIEKDSTVETVKDTSVFTINIENPSSAENQRLLSIYIDNKYNSDSPKNWANVLWSLTKKVLPSKQITLKNHTVLTKVAKNFEFQLVMLDREQQIQDVLDRKETKNYKLSEFKCELCYQGFSYIETYQNHMTIHDKSQQLECYACHATFSRRVAFINHIYRRHKFKLICKLCDNISRNIHTARDHYKNHLGHTYPCKHCGKVFAKDKSRLSHIQIHHGDVTCDICFQRVCGDFGLRLHKRRAHKDIYKCSDCSVQFHNADALKVHRETMTDGDCGPHIRPCTQCGVNFTKDDILQQHMIANHHGWHRREKVSKVIVRREKVGKVRDGKEKVGKEKVGIEKVGNEKVSKEKVGNEKPEKNKRLFVCDVCGLSRFASAAQMRYHQRIHTGEKPYSCDHCGKSYRYKHSLEGHLHKHGGGGRSFQCDVCSKTFTTRAIRDRHQRVVHTEVKSHPCTVCHKMFKCQESAIHHLKAVHLRLPSYCPVRDRKKEMERRKAKSIEKRTEF